MTLCRSLPSMLERNSSTSTQPGCSDAINTYMICEVIGLIMSSERSRRISVSLSIHLHHQWYAVLPQISSCHTLIEHVPRKAKVLFPTEILSDFKMADVTADLLSEFLEISVQQILVSRKLYPPQLFVKCRKYGLPLFQSKHSALSHYLSDLMESVRAFIRRGSLDKFVLSLLLNNQVAERFTFEVRPFFMRGFFDIEFLL
jgi:hypothetical protein